MEDVKSTVWHDLAVDDSGQAYVLEKHRVKAAFTETLELQSFPFDVQVRGRAVGDGLSSSRTEDPGFESRLRRDFSGVESYQ